MPSKNPRTTMVSLQQQPDHLITAERNSEKQDVEFIRNPVNIINTSKKPINLLIYSEIT